MFKEKIKPAPHLVTSAAQSNAEAKAVLSLMAKSAVAQMMNRRVGGLALSKLLKIEHFYALVIVLAVQFGTIAAAQTVTVATKKEMIHRYLLQIALVKRNIADQHEEYASILKLRPADATIHHDFGVLLWKEGKYQLAVGHLKAATLWDQKNALYKADLDKLQEYLKDVEQHKQIQQKQHDLLIRPPKQEETDD